MMAKSWSQQTLEKKNNNQTFELAEKIAIGASLCETQVCFPMAVVSFFFPMMESFSVERTGAHLKTGRGLINLLSSRLASDAPIWPPISSNLPGMEWNILLNLQSAFSPTYQSGQLIGRGGSFMFLWLLLASSEPLSPPLCSEAKNVQALEGD